jgi:membrane protein DedA with SNARE-associated domain
VKVVFFGRFVAVLRTFAAFFAGVSKMRWSRFLVANAAGGLLWAGVYAFGAYALGSAASSVGSTITIVGYVVAGGADSRHDRGGAIVAAGPCATSRGCFPRMSQRGV